MEDKNNNKRIIKILVLFIVVFGLIGLTTYAIVSTDFFGSNNFGINTTTLDVIFDDEVNGITLEDAYPISDSDAIASYTEYEFKVKNNAKINAMYNLRLESTCCDGTTNCIDKLDAGVLKYHLVNNDTQQAHTAFNPENNWYSESVVIEKRTGSNIHSYKLQVWINENAAMNQIYVTDEVGEFILDSNGKNIGKTYCAKVVADVVQVNE